LLLARGSVRDAMPEGELKDAVKHSEHMKAAVRSKVEHPFRVVKRQFGLQKVRFMGLVKNTVQILPCPPCLTFRQVIWKAIRRWPIQIPGLCRWIPANE
jgi:IS5 family transposase